ncbi:MAG: heat shock protein HslJ [Hyphomicrobiaceae bacterium]|jgi:heat shock protein HslJ
MWSCVPYLRYRACKSSVIAAAQRGSYWRLETNAPTIQIAAMCSKSTVCLGVTVSRFQLLSLLLLTIVTSCASQPARPADLQDLIGTWQFVGDVPVGARIPTLSVQRDGRIGGTSGVNRYQTALQAQTVSQGSFRVGATSGTRMMGTREAMQLESTFLQALAATDNAMIENDLLLLKQDDRCLLRFSRVSVR